MDNKPDTGAAVVETAAPVKLKKDGTPAVPRKKPPFSMPKRRPASPLHKWIKEQKDSYSITRADVAYIYRNIIFTSTVGQLKEMLGQIEGEKTPEEIQKIMDKRDSMPVLVAAVIAGVLRDIARGNTINLYRALDYVFPRAKEMGPDVETMPLAGGNMYQELLDMEAALRLLEGDDSIKIIDKLLLEEGAVKA